MMDKPIGGPGTGDPGRKCREVSLDGCRLLGSGQKGSVYRYDDELILKVYRNDSSYQDLEREIALSRRAFVLGLPTAISFGIVSVGDRYGVMYELLDSETLSACIAGDPARLDAYAAVMAELARTIHSTEAGENDCFPEAADRYRSYITHALARSDRALAEHCMRLIDDIPPTRHLIHGDFHTSNVFLRKDEALLIDMDRLATGDPIFELGDMDLYFAETEGKNNEDTDPYLGIRCETCRAFFDLFLRHYLKTQDEARLRETADQAALLGKLRFLSHCRRAETPSEEARREAERLLAEIRELLGRVQRLGLRGGEIVLQQEAYAAGTKQEGDSL